MRFAQIASLICFAYRTSGKCRCASEEKTKSFVLSVIRFKNWNFERNNQLILVWMQHAMALSADVSFYWDIQLIFAAFSWYLFVYIAGVAKFAEGDSFGKRIFAATTFFKDVLTKWCFYKDFLCTHKHWWNLAVKKLFT